ncbi:MAG: hypothetical protein WAN50_02330 [Minisyncoccia bacterium]
MSSKKKRHLFLVRDVQDEDIPNLFENLKESLLDDYKKKVADNIVAFNKIHEALTNEDEDKGNHTAHLTNTLHQKITRGNLIECIIILDLHIEGIIDQFQTRKLSLQREKRIKWSKIEEAISECLKGLVVPKEFQGKRSVIQNFRKLRHQFAHNPMGAFSFEDKESAFESFLGNLEGISIGQSAWSSRTNNEPGVVIPYTIVSSEFINIFYKESSTFISMFLEILFSDK